MRNIDGKVLQKVFEQSFNAIVVTDGSLENDGPRILYVNPAFCKMTGYERDELVGRNPRMLQGPSTERDVIDGLRSALEAGIYWEGETVNYRKDGTPYQVRWNISPIVDEDGVTEYFVSVQSDVSGERQARREQQLIAGALDAASDAVAVIDDQARILAANRALGSLAERDPFALRGERLHDALRLNVTADEATGWLRRLKQNESAREVVELQPPSGERKFVELRVSAMPDLDEPGSAYVLLGSDVSDRVEEERELRDQALRDDLTGLRNRRGADQELARMLTRADDRRRSFAAILTDIDRFKRVNDTHGHGVGDRILTSFAQVLLDTCRDEDVVARWGGEEFLILLDDADLSAGHRLAQRLRGAVAQMRDPDAGAITASFGVTEVRHDDDATTLLERVDGALYAAKENGRDRVEVA